MNGRIDYIKASPAGYKAFGGVHALLQNSSLSKELIYLVYLRASQINGCAYCLDMHSKDLRHGGETEQRIYMMSAWRETDLFTDRERAALSWAESVTLLNEGHVPDEVFEEVRKEFSEEELIDLTLAVASINSWNRLNIAFRTTAGSYQPGQWAAAAK